MGDDDDMLAEFARVGVDDGALAAQLQHERTEFFDMSGQDLMDAETAARRIPS